MKRAIWIGVLAVLAFACDPRRAPACELAGRLPARRHRCGQISGTVWNGSCAGLVAQGNALGDLTWKLHAASLLSGKLAAHVAMRGRPAPSTRMSSCAAGTSKRAGCAPTSRSIRHCSPQSPPDLRGHIRAELAEPARGERHRHRDRRPHRCDRPHQAQSRRVRARRLLVTFPAARRAPVRSRSETSAA